jgi:hypothetical protein
MTTTQSTEQAILSALSARSKLTATEIAATTKRGKSTVSKALGKLERDAKVRRSAGRRDGARRLPDRWSAAKGRQPARKGTGGTERLRPGQLDGLVLDYLRKHADDGPLGPTAVAKGLARSTGAVGNCLKRLATEGEVTQTGEAPLRYAAAKRARVR